MNYRLKIKDVKERQGYYGLMVKFLEKVARGEIESFGELNNKFYEPKEKYDMSKNEKITSKSYYKTLTFEEFQKDLQNITKFTTNNITDHIQGLNFKQVFDGCLNYTVGIIDHKVRAGYHGLMVKLLEKVATGEIQSFEELNRKFQEEKEKRGK